MQKDGKLFEDLVETIAFLRSEKGCPWDKKQTLKDMKKYLIEETYELCEAIDKEDDKSIAEECGDLILNLIMIANMLKEKEQTDIYEIIKNLKEKIVTRHPHVFGNHPCSNSEEVLNNWWNTKKTVEKKGIFSNIPATAPPLEKAYFIAKRAEKVGFGFEKDEDVLNKVGEEIKELTYAIKENNKSKIEEELGDLLFTLVNLSVIKDISPIDSLNNCCNKFLNRLQYIENRLDREGKTFQDMERTYIEKLWEESKGKV